MVFAPLVGVFCFMANTILVGAQWGDEGKGKIIDVLTEKADIVVRSQGGANAGHTVRVGDKEYILHLIQYSIERSMMGSLIMTLISWLPAFPAARFYYVQI